MTGVSTSDNASRATLEQVARDGYSKLLALLIHQFADIQFAEDVLQDAIIAAIDHWTNNELPQNPAGWLLQTARHKAIDRLRRRQNFGRKAESIQHSQRNEYEQIDSGEEAMQIPDERLRLIFTCCHPALSSNIRVALTLNTLCGLTVQQIANAFLVKETTMAQRLVRAKKKIKLAGIPYQVPDKAQLGPRLDTVLAVIYLIFNEGYFSSIDADLIDHQLCDQAMKLGQLLLQLMPDETEVCGLLALMLFHRARFNARVNTSGELVDLENQDRSRWQGQLIAEGERLLEGALSKGQPGPYKIQAAISALHSQADNFDDTDWKQIVLLYHRLVSIDNNPVVHINLAVALSFAEDAEIALAYLEQIESTDKLHHYHPYHSTRAYLLQRTGNLPVAASCYRQAIEFCHNRLERAYLKKKLAACCD